MITAIVSSCQSDAQVEFSRYYAGGASIYQEHCQNCHGEKGEGLQSLIPPLTDSIYLKNNKKLLACFLQNGLKGKITVNKSDFDDEMKPTDLAPIEIAKVLTYVTNSFGNKMGTVNLQMVEGDLAKCR
ncbi:c-type cytochrome [Mucilaginibacter flavus]|uniref:c-type cytochrome n=1 Tax=Mucilaginibacter flavus TaxID=931504 RepID=UPI0025B5DF2D|nr:cytochrome c [Mucilaginibacter flavus]MDN3584768.1 cytochrome c [Mucilaginibacter flavus]